MQEMAAHPWFGILLTVAVWIVMKKVRSASRTSLLDPVLLTTTVIILVLMAADIDYEAYNAGGRVISFLLGPAVVALAVPFYRQLEKIRKNTFAVLASVLTGCVVGIISASGLALLFGGSELAARSIAPKSATTPIAIGISEIIGGTPPLTIALVVLTGIMGAVAGPQLVRLVRIRSDFAIGLAVGTASHGLGTARALKDGELEGAMSGVAMMLNGLLTAILTPLIIRLLV